jgi:hypothetical protein
MDAQKADRLERATLELEAIMTDLAKYANMVKLNARRSASKFLAARADLSIAIQETKNILAKLDSLA